MDDSEFEGYANFDDLMMMDKEANTKFTRQNYENIKFMLVRGDYKLLDKEYEKTRIIGTGAFGKIWIAYSKIFDINFVLKETNFYNEEYQINAYNEPIILKYLSYYGRCNKYILCYYDSITMYHQDNNEGIVLLATEYINGKTISKYNIDNLKELNRVYIELWKGLKIMHDMGIVHMDIHSENIMITETGEIKFIDFGKACAGNSKIGGDLEVTICENGYDSDLNNLKNVCIFLTENFTKHTLLVDPYIQNIKKIYKSSTNVLNFLQIS